MQAQAGRDENLSMTAGHSDEPTDWLNARTRLFPFWWMRIGLEPQNSAMYRVECESAEEIQFAKAIKPEMIRAKYELVDHQRSS